MRSGARRDEIWTSLDGSWDLIVIGGGAVGAAVLREATRLGLRALLVEQRDFAWGTSSRSTKLVHGGLRYLAHGKVRLVRAAVRERQRLLAEAPALVTPVGMLLVDRVGQRAARWQVRLAVIAYDLIALRWTHNHYDRAAYQWLAPHQDRTGLLGGVRYHEARIDDARLVLRVIREAVAAGGVAMNYAGVTALLRKDNAVVGVKLRDEVRDRETDVRAKVVINATGAWADQLRAQIGAPARLRPLRGSHLLFPAWRFPVAQGLSFRHPLDGRYLSVIPWEGATLVGTTDVDHDQGLDDEPNISPAEVAYLMAAVTAEFPSLSLTLEDVLATFSGVRPVVDAAVGEPSRASREHAVLDEQGLVTVTGGKLTTARLMALDALEAARPRLPALRALDRSLRLLDCPSTAWDGSLSRDIRQRLTGRYGTDSPAVAVAARPGELDAIPGTPVLWAELRWGARGEDVVHLDDLLLRRVRLGLLLPKGGAALLPAIRGICQPELGWDDARWAAEETAYLALWQTHYGLPDAESIPDWRSLRAPARSPSGARGPSGVRRLGAVAGVGGLVMVGSVLARRRRARRASAGAGTRRDGALGRDRGGAARSGGPTGISRLP